MGWKSIWGARIFGAGEVFRTGRYLGRKSILGGRIFGAEDNVGTKHDHVASQDVGGMVSREPEGGGLVCNGRFT